MQNEITPEYAQQMALQKADSVINNLKMAWDSRPEDLSDEDERRLLQAMEAAKRLREEIVSKFGAVSD